ncbi:MAG: CNNM domain-containing protein [Planctomycetes bacterium]|nr:CNNM domain-containing protein [Planctomycetota bacterium]
MGLLVFYLALALGVSFLCSLLEASLLSVSVGYVNSMADKEHKGAKLMKSLKEAPDRALAAILSANTVAHTVGAAGVGAQVASIWGDNWLGLASGLLTIAILLLTEIVPKTLGTIHAKRLVGFTATTVQGMIYLLFPLVVASQVVGLVIAGGKKGIQISRDEVAAVADMGLEGGSLTASEAAAIRNLLALRTVRVSDIMTPRTVVTYVPADMTVGEFADSERETRFARMPVAEDGNIDKTIGVVHRAMILDAVREGEIDRKFREMARPIAGVPGGAPAAEAFEKVLKQSEHMLLVVDEYGGTAGVVTLEDIMETLLGVEIVDETDPTVDMRELARKLQQQRFSRRVSRGTPISGGK